MSKNLFCQQILKLLCWHIFAVCKLLCWHIFDPDYHSCIYTPTTEPNTLIYIFYFSELIAYVHSVSPSKRSRRNTEYFNCKLQTKDSMVNSVSYKMDLRSKLEEASKSKKAISLSGYRHVANWKDNSKQDLQLNKKNKDWDQCMCNFQIRFIFNWKCCFSFCGYDF